VIKGLAELRRSLDQGHVRWKRQLTLERKRR
jgi:hypothetical protein